MLKRTRWNERKARFKRRMDSFQTPLNDLGHDDRTSRVMCLMHNAYDMGREDQRAVTARRGKIKGKRSYDLVVEGAAKALAKRMQPALKKLGKQLGTRLMRMRITIG